MRLIGMVIMAAFPTDLSRIGRLKILDQQSSLNLFVTSAFQTGSSVTDMGAALVSKLQTTQSRGASRSETLKNRFSDAKSSKVTPFISKTMACVRIIGFVCQFVQ